MGSKQVKHWLGGYVRPGKKGPAFIIERWIDGTRYHVSTKCRTERAALEQLAVFEADPANYKPNRASHTPTVARSVVTVSADLVGEYVEWMKTRPEPATEHHVYKHGRCLMLWMRFYALRDVRTVSLREISEFLAGQRDRAMKIQALKAFCTWLRKEKFLLTRNEDPTVDLQGPTRRATKDTRDVNIEPERILAILPFLPDVTRDVLILRLGTGFHTREVQRFALEGRITYTPGEFVWLALGEGPQRVPLLATLHVDQKKAGRMTNTPIIYGEHLAAAERLLRRRQLPHDVTMTRHVRAACKKAGVPRFLNWHIRHSVVTYASNHGADLEQSSVFVDHLNIDTTRTHYRQQARPTKAVPVLRVLDGKKSG